MPLEKRAEIAFKIAAAKATDEYPRLGLPVHIWRDGRVVEMSPNEAHYRFLANANSSAVPAAMPATASPVRFMFFSMAATCGRTQASSG